MTMVSKDTLLAIGQVAWKGGTPEWGVKDYLRQQLTTDLQVPLQWVIERWKPQDLEIVTQALWELREEGEVEEVITEVGAFYRLTSEGWRAYCAQPTLDRALEKMAEEHCKAQKV